jgi:site-specific DNA recombinase
MTTKPKAAVYTRVSIQNAISLQDQSVAIQTLAKKHGYEIDEKLTFSDTGSAKKLGRPGFEEMMNAIESGKAESSIAFKLDRLARNPVDGGKLIYFLQKGLIKELITEDGTYASDSDSVLLYLQFGMANQFSLPKRRKHPESCDCCCCESRCHE